eukprot:sb/3474087/
MPLAEDAGLIGDIDQEEAIKLHQAALSKLQQLQQNMVTAGEQRSVVQTTEATASAGGAKRSKQEIKEKLRKRREVAEAKRRKLRKAMADGDDDGVIEELFSLQMEETLLQSDPDLVTSSGESVLVTKSGGHWALNRGQIPLN